MTKLEQLTILQGARELLDRKYIKWFASDGDGGHCSTGVVLEYSNRVPSNSLFGNYYTLMGKLNTNATALYPELVGVSAPRKFKATNGSLFDYFDLWPMVYVNNQLGKEAALAVFDLTITELQSELHATGQFKFPTPDFAPVAAELGLVSTGA